MNNKTKVIIAAGLLFAASLPVVACARKAPEAYLLPSVEPLAIDLPVEAVAVPEAAVIEQSNQFPEINFTGNNFSEQETLLANADEKAEQNKTAKKAAKKTTKKAAKKKAKKSTKKSSKKSSKKTSNKKFTYGKSVYTCKSFEITVHISKDNKVSASVIYMGPDKTVYRKELNFSMSGKLDPKTNTFTYTNGTCREIAHTDRGIMCNRANYLHGSGKMVFNGNYLNWTDNEEHIADSHTFHKQ